MSGGIRKVLSGSVTDYVARLVAFHERALSTDSIEKGGPSWLSAESTVFAAQFREICPLNPLLKVKISILSASFAAVETMVDCFQRSRPVAADHECL